MSGRIITIILKKGPGFPLFGSPPTFWPLMVGPELSWCLWVLMCYNECIMSLKVPSKANLSPYCARSVLTSFCVILNGYVGIPWWYNGKESACQYRRCRRFWFDPWVGRSLVKEMATHSSILAWKNLVDRGAWQATICLQPLQPLSTTPSGVAESDGHNWARTCAQWLCRSFKDCVLPSSLLCQVDIRNKDHVKCYFAGAAGLEMAAPLAT